MLIGYARVSTAEQSLALQQDALATAGCERTYTDVISGATETRDGLDAASSASVRATCSWCGASTGSGARSGS